MVTIRKVFIRNFMGIDEDVSLPLDGQSLVLYGPNGTGKTSLLQAIYSVLDPKSMPEQPISHGKDKAKVEIEFEKVDEDGKKTHVTAKLSLNEKKHTLQLTIGDYIVKSPRKNLDKLIGGNVNFNPVDFALKSKTVEGRRDQAKVIMNILDLDLSEFDKAITEFEGKRLDSHRTLTDLKARKKLVAEKLPEDAEKYSTAISLGQLLEEQTLLKSDVKQSQEATLKIENKKKREVEVRAKIEKLNDELKCLLEDVSLLEDIVESNQDSVQKMVALDSKLATVEEHNKLHAIVKDYNDTDDKIGTEETNHKNLDLNIKSQRESKLTRIENRCSELDLGFQVYIQEGRTWIDRTPIEQLNTAKQIEVGLKLYMNTNPKLRVVRLSMISLCDKKTKQAICEFINKNKIQAFVEQVAVDADKLQIDIEQELKLK